MLTREYGITIDCGVGLLGHVREFVGGFNDTGKIFLSVLMNTVKLPGVADYDTYIAIHTATVLRGNFRKIFHIQHVNMELFIKVS